MHENGFVFFLLKNVLIFFLENLWLPRDAIEVTTYKESQEYGKLIFESSNNITHRGRLGRIIKNIVKQKHVGKHLSFSLVKFHKNFLITKLLTYFLI